MSGWTLGQNITNNQTFLKRLWRCSSEKGRWRLLRKATSSELLSLVEICANILRPDCFLLHRRQREKLVPHADRIRRLARKRTDTGARRFLIQEGSGPFFAALLGPIILEGVAHLLKEVVPKN
jgi:hypothetical protein